MSTKLRTSNFQNGSVTGAILSATAVVDSLGYTPADANNIISTDSYARDKANSANVLAQAAYDSSNTKLSLSGGTLTGSLIIDNNQNLTVTGNLIVTGNVTSVSANNLIIDDPMIVLANNNTTTDLLDIGFIGHYGPSGQNRHTGFVRHASTNEYYVFYNYDKHIHSTNNIINIADASFLKSNINANAFKGNLIATSASISGSLGVGTTASGTTGEIRATNDITAFYSDDRLKTKLGNIENALDKLTTLSGFYYEPNQTAQDLGYEVKRHVGVSAQDVQAVMPEVVKPAPISDQYLTVQYEKLIPLLIEAIKELKSEVDELKGK
jgi:hypothetical protein